MMSDVPRSRYQDNPHFVEYERLLRRVQALHNAGLDTSAEVDEVLSAMDSLVPYLGQDEIDRLNGLSADLYMLSGDEIAEPLPLDAPDEKARLRMIAEAFGRNECERVLALLRYGLSIFPQDKLALTRGRCYSKLGHVDSAILFFEYAASLAPQNAEYHTLAVVELTQAGRYNDAAAIARRLLPSNTTAQLRVFHASALILATHNAPADVAAGLFGEAEQVLFDVITGLKGRALESPDIRHQAYTMYGFALAGLGRQEEAKNAFDSALQIVPDDEVTLVLRGNLLWETNNPQAVDDFQRAVASRTVAMTPYFFLGGLYLARGDFAACYKICTQALRSAKNPRFRAIFLHWSAIARFEEYGITKDAIRDFNKAMRLDPANQTIRHNFAVLENKIQASAAARTGTWLAVSSTVIRELEVPTPRVPALPSVQDNQRMFAVA